MDSTHPRISARQIDALMAVGLTAVLILELSLGSNITGPVWANYLLGSLATLAVAWRRPWPVWALAVQLVAVLISPAARGDLAEKPFGPFPAVGGVGPGGAGLRGSDLPGRRRRFGREPVRAVPGGDRGDVRRRVLRAAGVEPLWRRHRRARDDPDQSRRRRAVGRGVLHRDDPAGHPVAVRRGPRREGMGPAGAGAGGGQRGVEGGAGAAIFAGGGRRAVAHRAGAARRRRPFDFRDGGAG